MLAGELCDHDTSHIEAFSAEFVDETKDVAVRGDAEITADLVLFNRICADGDDDFRLVRKLHQHTQFTVRSKSRKNSGSMVIVKKLSAKFQIQFIVKLVDSFTNVF